MAREPSLFPTWLWGIQHSSSQDWDLCSTVWLLACKVLLIGRQHFFGLPSLSLPQKAGESDKLAGVISEKWRLKIRECKLWGCVPEPGSADSLFRANNTLSSSSPLSVPFSKAVFKIPSWTSSCLNRQACCPLISKVLCVITTEGWLCPLPHASQPSALAGAKGSLEYFGALLGSFKTKCWTASRAQTLLFLRHPGHARRWM